MTKKSFTSILLFMISAVCFGQDQVETRFLLPESEFLPNWTIRDSIEIYSGENLFKYINGGADVYFEYGFEEVAAGSYSNHQSNSVLVDIYKMSSTDAAYGIFTLSTSVKGRSIELGDQSFLYDYYLDVWKGPFFIRLSANKKENGMIDTLVLFAQRIDSNIAVDGELPRITAAFRIAGMEIGNIKYFKGIIGLNNIYNFGHGSLAGFTKGLYGQWEDKLLFIFAYQDEQKRREWFASARGKMQMSRKFSDYSDQDDGFTVNDKSGSYLCFKPFKTYILVIQGLSWENSKSVFELLQHNLDGN